MNTMARVTQEGAWLRRRGHGYAGGGMVMQAMVMNTMARLTAQGSVRARSMVNVNRTHAIPFKQDV